MNEIYDPPEELAKHLGISVRTLANWRNLRKGPTYIKVGKLVKYPRSKRDQWIQDRTVNSSEGTA